MKKTLLSICILISTVTFASAQLLPTFQLGIKGGLNFSSLKTDDNWFDKSSRTGYQAGLWARIGGAGFHFQPELYVTGKNAKATVNEGDAEVKMDFTSLDLPLLLGTRIGLGPIAARVQVGPVISFLIDKDNSIFDRLGDVGRTGSYKSQAIALTGGVGVDIMRLRADLRYEHGLSNLTKDGAESQKLNLWTIGIGYRLF
ncbi:porin family protein [Olivibacter domesticus]|uniref:Outer membrane protein beta-barrel domain-containing protein n=1 Tax=Olivibacter domesticus TaxID=407022 RepID=A0A1H7RYE0_OLID1|nr:porin family protein [Olivibacter domesticus]SEL65118.1 Outer membrane protein beta-barrel domain-containing protein [Olivibacter domesticus]